MTHPVEAGWVFSLPAGGQGTFEHQPPPPHPPRNNQGRSIEGSRRPGGDLFSDFDPVDSALKPRTKPDSEGEKTPPPRDRARRIAPHAPRRYREPKRAVGGGGIAGRWRARRRPRPWTGGTRGRAPART